MRKLMTNEEKVAKTIGTLISDLRLDLEAVAIYIHEINPNVAINRILLMADILRDEKESKHNDHL